MFHYIFFKFQYEFIGSPLTSLFLEIHNIFLNTQCFIICFINSNIKSSGHQSHMDDFIFFRGRIGLHIKQCLFVTISLCIACL